MTRRGQDRPIAGKESPDLPGSTATDNRTIHGTHRPIPRASSDDSLDSFTAAEAAPRWMHLSWSISAKSGQRAASALGGNFHRAQLVIRAAKLRQSDIGPPSSEPVLEVDIDPQAREWFIRLPDEHDLWSFELGYRGPGRFFTLDRTSHCLSSAGRKTPLAETKPLVAADIQDILRDDGTSPPLELHGTFAISGRTAPFAQITIDEQGLPVDSQTGEFFLRFPAMPGRNVYAVVASAHGRHRRGLLAVEVNVHLLDEEPPEEP